MESWCRWLQQSLNDRQDRWETEIASERQVAKDEIAAQADALGIECEDWGREIDEIENIANLHQKAAWYNQDSLFLFQKHTVLCVCDVSDASSVSCMNAVSYASNKKTL